MGSRLLAVLVVVGLVLAPFLPSQRLYLCQVTGQVMTACCCHVDQSNLQDGDTSGCCKVVVIHTYLAPGHPQGPSLPVDQTLLMTELPIAPVVSLLTTTWTRLLPPRSLLSRSPDRLFVRNCSWLT